MEAGLGETRDDHAYELEYELVAQGDQGDEEWKPQFRSLEEVQRIISQLDAIGENQIKWEALIGSCKYFENLRVLQFPPLYDLGGFADLSNDFWHVLDSPEKDDEPMQSFNWSRLYLKRNRADTVKHEFELFWTHLRSMPWLKELL
jgi:hypothetical protein